MKLTAVPMSPVADEQYISELTVASARLCAGKLVPGLKVGSLTSDPADAWSDVC